MGFQSSFEMLEDQAAAGAASPMTKMQWSQMTMARHGRWAGWRTGGPLHFGHCKGCANSRLEQKLIFKHREGTLAGSTRTNMQWSKRKTPKPVKAFEASNQERRLLLQRCGWKLADFFAVQATNTSNRGGTARLCCNQASQMSTRLRYRAVQL